MSDVFDEWDATTDEELTVELVEKYFDLVSDELYIATAAVDRVVDDLELQRLLLSKAITSTDAAVEKGKAALSASLLLREVEEPDSSDGDAEENGGPLDNEQPPSLDDTLIRLLTLRAISLRRQHLLESYEFLSKHPSWNQRISSSQVSNEVEEDDPWADEVPEASSPDPPFSLSEFLTLDVVLHAVRLANSGRFETLRLLMVRHSSDLFPFRFTVLEAVPAHYHPLSYGLILPTLDHVNNRENMWGGTSIQDDADWVETTEGRNTFIPFAPEELRDLLPGSNVPFERRDKSLSGDELSVWYKGRINFIDAHFGLTDIAFELVQHGASQGIPGLDELGEELSLLSRLVYDAPKSDESSKNATAWSLERWRSLDEAAVVRGYVAHSTPFTIADDIRRLVMPYLFVLEARQERAGNPDPSVTTRHLYDYILNAPLHLCAAIFDASKPTAVSSQCIIRSDEDLARLALARLYGSGALDQWPTMSSIFECLPEWPVPPPEDVADGDAEADTTLVSLSAFVQPSTTRARTPLPSDLFLFFSPLPAPALSRALDVLDVHLECGEILARWNVPAPLAWFLQSANDEREQRSWATRMARRATLRDDDEDVKSVQDEKTYANLLKDMRKLVGSGSDSARGAFRLLGKEQVTKIFFSGLLSSGKFDVARKLLQNPSIRQLDSHSIENLCLTASREFYDNATSGNLHHGDMKLAYECLSVPPQTDAIRVERDLIEATSRICSFRVMSRPGILITPLEIRLVKDRLSLIARVLSENDDAYKHPNVIFDLVHKLGVSKGDVVSEIKTFAMLADSALQAEDFLTAADTAEQMVLLLNQSLRRPSLNGSSSHIAEKEQEAVEVCWHSCFQLGRQSEFRDIKRKLRLLGHALQLCPPENTLDVLSVWRRLEAEDIEARKVAGGSRRSRRDFGNGSGVKDRLSSRTGGRSATLSEQLSEYAASTSPLLNQGADAAALAAKTFGRVAANFPLSLRGIRGRTEEESVESPGAPSASPDVSTHARQALARGMGWLIGDE